MKDISLVAIFTLTMITQLLFGHSAQAELLCSKAKLKNGKIKLTYSFVSTTTCPKGFSKAFDTASLENILGQNVGPQGPKGDKGDTGASGSPDTPEQILTKLLQVDGPSSGLDAATVDGFTATDLSPAVSYIRWGRYDCPVGSTKIYDGYAATSNYTQSGGGSNLLCLSKDPTSTGTNSGNQNGALIYGVEYETSGYGLSALAPLQNYEVPCALCQRDNAKIVFMQPGRDICPSGTTLEYPGYLMASHYTHTKSEFVCVDQQPLAIGSNLDSNGGLLYPTEAECGSLPCSPYTQDRELTCSVCTK